MPAFQEQSWWGNGKHCTVQCAVKCEDRHLAWWPPQSRGDYFTYNLGRTLSSTLFFSATLRHGRDKHDQVLLGLVRKPFKPPYTGHLPMGLRTRERNEGKPRMPASERGQCLKLICMGRLGLAYPSLGSNHPSHQDNFYLGQHPALPAKTCELPKF